MEDFLSQEQIDQLPDGTAIEVVWSGGNGPHRYEIKRFRGVVYAFDGQNNVFVSPLVWVGTSSPSTTVKKITVDL